MAPDTLPSEGPTAASPWPRVAAVVLVLTAIISVVLTAFAWPAARSSVHELPIAVAGAPAVADPVAAALRQHQPGAFSITRVADTTAAEAAVRDRDAYGAIDVSTGRPQLIIASAASPVVAQTLRGVADALAQASLGTAGSAVTVRDVAALPAQDPRGAGLAAGSLPLVIGGLIAAVLLSTRIRGLGRRVSGAFAFAVTGGLAMAAILQFWLGSLAGSYWANSGVVALSVAATSLTVLGLESLFGAVGLGFGGAVMVLLGNPLSGTTSAPQMLPGWSGTLGQLMPPGAAGSLLRSTAFFDGHGAWPHAIVLAAWLVLGAVLCAISGLPTAGRRATATRATPRPGVTTTA